MSFRSLKTKLVGEFNSLLFSLILIVLSVLLVLPISTFAFNQQINYQGKLTTALNAAVTNGNYSIVFTLYDASSGGNVIWTETQTVTVTSGLFSTMLGSVNSLSSVNFNQTLYLGVKVGTDNEMTPRKTLGAVPAAFEANKLDGYNASDFLKSASTSDDLTEGSTHLFYSNVLVASYLNSTTSDALTEGSHNLYYTDQRVNDLIIASSTIARGGCASNEILKWSGTAWLCSVDLTGSGGAGSWWATSTNSLVGYPNLAAGYAIVVGGTATTSNVKFEVVGDTKLGGNLNITGNASITSATITAATSTNFYSSSFSALSSLITNLLATNATVTAATSTNFYSTALSALSGTITNFLFDKATGTQVVLTTASTSNLIATNATITAATSTSFYSSIFSAVSGLFSNLVATNATTTNATSTNFYATNINSSNLSFSNATGDNLTLTGLSSSTDLIASYATSTYLNVTGLASTTDLHLTGIFYDSTNSAGTNGLILQTTGTATRWVATSTLGITSSQWTTLDSNIYYSVGSVGIGTSTPDAILTIDAGTNASTDFLHLASSTNDNILIVDKNGNVGIGQAPTQTDRLTVRGNLSVSDSIYSSGLEASTAFFDSLGVGSSSSEYLLVVNGSANLGTTTITNLVVTNTSTSTFAGGLTVGTSQLVVDKGSGYVGIGTSSPSTALTVVDSAAGDTILRLFKTSSAKSSYLSFSPQSSNWTSSNVLWNIGMKNNDDQNFYFTNWNGSTTNYPMAILSSGNVGIGTTTPSYSLDVSGNFRVSYGNTDIAKFLSTSGAVSRILVDSSVPSDTQIAFMNNGSTKWSIGNDTTNDSLNFMAKVGAFDGTQAMTILSSGNVGIGTTTPATMLELGNGGDMRINGLSGYYGQISDDGGALSYNAVGSGAYQTWSLGGTEYMRLVSGKVGIGTTTPDGLLTVNSSVTGPQLYLTNSATAPTNVGLRINSPNSSVAATRNWALVANNTVYGDFNLLTSDALGGDPIAAGTSRLYINSSGSVGIGTTTPQSQLHITNDTYSTDANSVTTGSIFGASSQAGTFGVYMRNRGNSAGISGNTYVNQILTGSVGNGMEIYTSGAGNLTLGTAATTRMTIVGSGSTVGYIGIGTTTPNYKLTVNTGGFSVEDSTTNYGGFQVSSNGRITSVTGLPSGTGVTTASFVINPSGTGDTNRKLLGIAVAGVERMSVDVEGDVNILKTLTVPYASTTAITSSGSAWFAVDSGNVGIGTSSPWAKLSINNYSAGASTVPLFVISSSTGSGATTTHFIVNSAGYTGINTTAPNAHLTVMGDATGGTLNNTFLVKSSNASVNLKSYTTTNGDGLIINHYYQGSALSYARIADIVSNAADTSEAQMRFLTKPASGNASEAMRITGAGNVGIGTTSPSGKLHVSGGSLYMDNNQQLRFLDSAGSSYASIGLTSGNNFQIVGKTGISQYSAGTSHVFYTGGVSFTSELMRIASDGNIGIGTTTPWAKLSINNYNSGVSTVPLFVISSSTGSLATSTQLIVTSVGNVGIGTTSPSAKLEIWDSGTIANSGSVADFRADDANVWGLRVFSHAYSRTTPILGVLGASTGAGSFYNQSINTMTLDAGYVGIGTTTPTHLLTVSSSTVPQISLSAGAGLAQWTFRNAGGNFYLSTTTVAGTATSTTNALSIIGSSGNIGIGTTSPYSLLSVGGASAGTGAFTVATTGDVLTTGNLTVGDGTSNATLRLEKAGTLEWQIYNDNNTYRLYVVSSTSAGVYISPGATSWTASSDLRLKENLVPIENALEKVMKLTGYVYNFKGQTRREVGLIAQDVLPNFPELVDASGEYLGLNYDRLGPVIIQAIKEQQMQINLLASSTATSTTTVQNIIDANLRSISSLSGAWSISEDGYLKVKKLEAEEILVEKGITIKDQATGEQVCVYVENSAIKTKAGRCDGINTNGSNTSATIGNDNSSASTTETNTTENSSSTASTTETSASNDSSSSDSTNSTEATETTATDDTTANNSSAETSTTVTESEISSTANITTESSTGESTTEPNQ